MNERILSYEADLNQEYRSLTKKHKEIKGELEDAILKYLEGENSKPITIQGPYGSGKTQLLYHLFKFTYDKGGIGIYTQLEKIIPSQKMGPSEYANYLKELVNEEVNLLRKNNSKLMSGKVKDFAINRINQVGDNSKIVLFVDEIEQQYKLLDEIVETDDHSPMRDVIARVNNGEAGFYLVLAFAPVSFYEFSKGEAQTRRYLPILLPIVEPKTSREHFREIGNLVWWMGRGRYGWMLRIDDILKANVSNINEISKKELQDICLNTGPIGGVNALEFEMIEKIDDFNNFRDFVIRLEPKEEGGEIYAGTLKVVKKCHLIYCNQRQILEILEKSLRESKVSKVTDISYYLSIILDALSTSDGKIPLFTDLDDWRELLAMTEELILEFEGEDKLPSEDLKLLQDNISDFSYNIRKNADDLGKLEGFCIAPEFLHKLFPFPTSSPNLIPDKKIDEQRENLADQTYLGRVEENGISVFFFLNADKIRSFLIQESKNYLKETKVLVAVNLGPSKEDIEKPKLAQWLERQGRLRIIQPPRILSDFLVSFFYWVRNEKKESLPITNLFEKLTDSQSVSEKSKARKIAYYNSRINEYMKSELPRKASPKYILGDKTGFDEFRAGRVGFVPEVIGFSFVDSKNDWEAVYKFRNEFKSSQFIQKESTSKRTGLPTAVEKLVVYDKKTGGFSKGAVLKRISDSFSNYLPDLTEVVNETNKDEFVSIPADPDSERIFEGIYLYLREWKDPSKAEEKFGEAKSNWSKLRNRISDISKKIREFEKLTDERILLTHCLEIDETRIANIEKILDDYQTKISPYTKFLLSTFVEKLREVLEPKLNEIEKRFSSFKNSLEDKIKEYKAAIESVQDFEDDTFVWLNKSQEEIQNEIIENFSNVCQNFTKGGKIDLESIPDTEPFIEDLKGIIEELQTLDRINESIKQCKEMAQKINEKLRNWR